VPTPAGGYARERREYAPVVDADHVVDDRALAKPGITLSPDETTAPPGLTLQLPGGEPARQLHATHQPARGGF
jgi:hypothetical protein